MMEQQRLTDFQKLMRSWKQLAPYNAAHVLRVSGPPDTARWEEAFGRLLRQLGIGRQLNVESSDLDFDRTITRELNRPFESSELPLRVIATSTASDHFLTLTYDHWFADSPSMRALLQRAFNYYGARASDLPPLEVAPGLHSDSTSGAILGGIRTYQRHRRAARIHLRDPLDFETGFFSRQFPVGVIDPIRSNARKRGAKVNDVFLAAAAQVLGQTTAAQRASSRRNEVAIASAVDLRDSAAHGTFGFDVTYFSVVLANPEKTSFENLVQLVAQQTGAMKKEEEIARFNLSLKCARIAYDLTSKPKRRAELFRKVLPLVSGISNVNLSGTWVEDATRHSEGPRLLDYLRVSPVGPLLPLVFTLTTIVDRLSLCVSYRSTAFAGHAAAKLTDDFMAKLIAFAETWRP
ncbi:MAG: hypothetical protein ACJ8JD_07630 [Chthoniobacterales bacterium]